MRNSLIIIAILLAVIALWYYSLVLSPAAGSLPEIKVLLGEVNNWFAIMALTVALFALILVVLKMESNQKQFESFLRQNNLSMEIFALSQLIQESDATLHRYDRWEAAGIKGDYVNAKSSVREKMNAQRDLLEQKYEEIAGLR